MRRGIDTKQIVQQVREAVATDAKKTATTQLNDFKRVVKDTMPKEPPYRESFETLRQRGILK